MSPRRSAAEIIGFHLGWDIAEVREGRYQRYINPAVYVCGGDYFASPPAGSKAPTHDVGGPWVHVGSYYGRDVFRAKSEGKGAP